VLIIVLMESKKYDDLPMPFKPFKPHSKGRQ